MTSVTVFNLFIQRFCWEKVDGTKIRGRATLGCSCTQNFQTGSLTSLATRKTQEAAMVAKLTSRWWKLKILKSKSCFLEILQVQHPSWNLACFVKVRHMWGNTASTRDIFMTSPMASCLNGTTFNGAHRDRLWTARDFVFDSILELNRTKVRKRRLPCTNLDFCLVIRGIQNVQLVLFFDTIRHAGELREPYAQPISNWEQDSAHVHYRKIMHMCTPSDNQ